MALERGQVGLVSREGTPTGRTAMRGVAEMEVDRSAAEGVTEIMNSAGGHTPTASATPTGEAAPAGVVAAAPFDARLRKVLNLGDSFGDIGQIDAWSTHRSYLLTQ